MVRKSSLESSAKVHLLRYSPRETLNVLRVRLGLHSARALQLELFQRIFLLILLLVSSAGCGGCDTNGGTAASGVSGASASQVILIDGAGTENTVAVELADTPEKRATGLMFRQSLDPNAGMLFVYTSDSTDAYFMKNTLISLDLIFISSDLKIETIAKETIPFSENLITSDQPFRYVLEVRAGYTTAHNLTVGDSVKIK